MCNVHIGDVETPSGPQFQKTVLSECHMAQQVKQATHAVHNSGTDTDATDAESELATSRFRHHRHLRHGKNPIYTHKSSSSLLLADDEDDLAGSPDEGDGELRQPHYRPNNSQPVAPHIVVRPKYAQRCSSHSSDGVN